MDFIQLLLIYYNALNLFLHDNMVDILYILNNILYLEWCGVGIQFLELCNAFSVITNLLSKWFINLNPAIGLFIV